MAFLAGSAFLAFTLLVCAALIYFRDLFRNQPEPDVMSDIAVVRTQIANAKTAIENMKARAPHFVVDDEASYKAAYEIIKIARATADDAEAQRDKFVKPLNALVKMAREDARPVIEGADEVERVLKEKTQTYRNNVERVKLEAQEAAKRALAAQAPPQALRAAHVAVAVLTVPKIAGVSAPRDNFKGKIINQALVPDRFWIRVISQALIDADIDMQVKAAKAAGKLPSPVIPGVEITNNQIEAIRV